MLATRIRSGHRNRRCGHQGEERKLPSLPIRDFDCVRVGDVIVAFGNPFGLEGTATLGIVDTLMRNKVGHEIFEDFITNKLAVEMPPL
jgi:serine protease Do